MGRVWLTPALIVQAEQDEETRGLRGPLEVAGLRVTTHPAGLLIEGAAGRSAPILTAEVQSILEASGKTPQFRQTPETLTGDERFDSTTNAESL